MSADNILAQTLPDYLSKARFFAEKTHEIVGINEVIAGKAFPTSPPDPCGYRFCVVDVYTVSPSEGDDRQVSTYLLCLPADSEHPAVDLLSAGDPVLLRDIVTRLAAGTDPTGGLARRCEGTNHPGGGIGIAEGDEARLLGVEQSNTSMCISSGSNEGQRPGMMVKFFRSLEPGTNPDVELLSRIAECPHIAPVRDAWEILLPGTSSPATVAMVQDKIESHGDGWALLTDNSAAASAGLTAARFPMRDLGHAIAVVHKALRHGFGTRAVATDQVFAALRQRCAELVSAVPELAEYEPRVLEFYDTCLSQSPESVRVQRIHGDLHLGQVLLENTTNRWILIDFEGEPARSVESRRQADCLERDLAGMVRSLDYAACTAGLSAEVHRDLLTSLYDGYAGSGNGEYPYLAPLVDAYTVDKALYEVAYELNNRPDWAWIPRQGLARSLGMD